MKTKSSFLLTTILLGMLLTATVSHAQQIAPTPIHETGSSTTANYTYRVFQAPNKNFGYDILRNGKVVYHEFASMDRPENIPPGKNSRATTLNGTPPAFANKGNLTLVKQEHAEKAASLAIEKMKRKQSPVLSQEEIRKIIAQ